MRACLRQLGIGAVLLSLLTSCGSTQPLDAGSLIQLSSQRMIGLRGFHFTMSVQGATGSGMPVQSAQGYAGPEDLTATVDLKEGGVLLEVDLVLSGGSIYVKSFTGGWLQLTQEQAGQFFDVHALFDRSGGLFAAMRETGHPVRVKQESVDGQSTSMIAGSLPAARVNRLLPVARADGSDQVGFWIDDATHLLWRASLSGNLFDPDHPATITFDFSKHDQAVLVTPPPLG